MKRRILRYLKHILFTILILLVSGTVALLLLGNRVKFNRNRNITSKHLHNEGPFILYEKDSSLTVNYIQGNETDGYYLDKKRIDTVTIASVHYYPDTSTFQFRIDPARSFEPETSAYPDAAKIIAISDIEGGYESFRKLLISNKVTDAELNWTFGDGHLVLIGDFVDRGHFVTQVLLLIYKLDQEASASGGKVHYILGNHELLNMQGEHGYAAGKYAYASSILGLKHAELYDNRHTLIGKWMHSKNVVEKIGDYIFTHGGLHPDFVKSQFSIAEINALIRAKYDRIYYHERGNDKMKTDLLFDSEKSPYWYRGYFQDDLDIETIDSVLSYFSAKRIIVGHTIQGKIRSHFDGKILGIDVEHPQEQWGSYFPSASAEALLIEDEKFYKVNDRGERYELE